MQEWKREYIERLDYEKRLFEKEFHIKLSAKFDPARWVRSYFLREPQVRWSNIQDCGSNCNAIDLWFIVFSERDVNKDYALRMKYKLYKQIYYPYEWEHSCDDTFSWETSNVRLYCKHLYAVLLFIDKNLLEKCKNMAESTFVPNERFLFDAKKIVYSKEKAPEKVSQIFGLMKEELTLNEGYKLERLNRRIDYLRKV